MDKLANLKTEKVYMNMALDLARKGDGYTSPNPMVGAVIVKDGKIVGRGYHKKAGLPHAEVMAIADAKEEARGATLYVTLEPCNHTGKTPPCTELILASGIKKVVAAMKDPNPLVNGRGLEYLYEKGLEISEGIYQRRAEKLNEAFIKYMTKNIPFVILKCASTLDGRIATKTGDSKWITNEKSRAFVHQIRHSVDAIIIGIGTVISDNPRLTTRLPNKKGIDPIRVILDTKLRIPLDAKILNLDSDSPTIIATQKSETISEKENRLLDKGIRFLHINLKDGLIDLNDLMIQLGKLNILSLLIEGGSNVNMSVIKQRLADKVYMFFAPKFLGGDDGIPVCSGTTGLDNISESLSIKNVTSLQFDNDIMIEGYF